MKSVVKPILPGGTIGMLGSGQLGRMFALEAGRMGYRVHVFSPDRDSPAGQVADLEIAAAYDAPDALDAFAREVEVVTLEFENIPVETVARLEGRVPVRPGREALYIAQNRLREKRFLAEKGFPVAPFRAVNSLEELQAAAQDIGLPAVLKTAGFGYDGKSQVRITSPAEIEAAFSSLGGQPAILEAFIPFEREVSVVGARGLDGSFAHYDVVENIHRRHILDITLAPAEVPEKVSKEAVRLCRGVMEALEVVGVLCVEFFLRDGTLLINEIAPRPHNSGHFTVDACVTSQFEGQLRAVCALPLGSTELLRPAAMANLLGDLWEHGEPDWAAALSTPGVKLHLYGKREARPGRKMGHLTALGETPEEARRKVERARAALGAVIPP
jgi:5-(carboxyamino)imidazole ribonucleotide synthase